MRIIGGKLSGRKLEAPASRATRPTGDRVREAVFNIIAHHEWGKMIGNPLAKTHVLDAFCGTGALAFEALSRGSMHAVLLDKDRLAFQCLNEIRLNGIFEKNRHGSLGFKIRGADGFAFARIADDGAT